MNIREYFDLLRQGKTKEEIAAAMPTLTCPHCGGKMIPYWDTLYLDRIINEFLAIETDEITLSYLCVGECEQEFLVDLNVNPDTGQLSQS